MSDLVADLLAGKHSALARVITKIENRSPGYREIISDLHQHTGTADVIGVTGSPGAGKSTLVDKVAATYRERGQTVGVIAIDPSSPFSGGAVLGDRIRMASNAGDMDMFFRSMSARGSLGGLSTATTDAVTALDAFGKDKIIVETVGAGQNEVDIVRTADTVAVLVPPGSGDDVQMLKAGILEIGDVFVVNKADLDGADRTVQQLREMLQGRSGRPDTGHHGATELAGDHGGASAGEGRRGTRRLWRRSPTGARASRTSWTRWPTTARTWTEPAAGRGRPESASPPRSEPSFGRTQTNCWSTNSTGGAASRATSTPSSTVTPTRTRSSTKCFRRSESVSTSVATEFGTATELPVARADSDRPLSFVQHL
jgi:putative protein kinase ArgK-like GTPase of G3E family